MMYIAYIMRRTQIYLDESQVDRLAERAAAQGTTRSDLIREAVDAYLAGSGGDERSRLKAFRAAVRAAAGAVARLPEGRRFVEETREADAGRERDLERRRRG
jgi:hypothetical protein